MGNIDNNLKLEDIKEGDLLIWAQDDGGDLTSCLEVGEVECVDYETGTVGVKHPVMISLNFHYYKANRTLAKIVKLKT